MYKAQHTPESADVSHFALMHFSQTTPRFSFREEVKEGALMDAPEMLPIGCTSSRQDLIARGFDAQEAFIEVCLLRGFGEAAYMTAFEYECYFNRSANTQAT